MKLAQTTTMTIDTSAPASFTCSQCPFARPIEDNRYCCQVSQTASDVKRGHWEATLSCFEALAKAEVEKTPEPVATQTEATAIYMQNGISLATPLTPAPATLSAEKPAPATSPTTPEATGENDEPPNRGDNGHGRVQPIAAAKKLLPSIVPVARIKSDIPASNFDQNELEIAGERASGDRRFCYSQAC